MVRGQATTYDLTVGVIVDIEDMIHQLDPFDTPLLGTYGADGRSTLSSGSCFEKKVEWLDDTLLAPRDALNGSVTSAATEFVVDTGLKFTKGDVVLVDSEYVRVTSVDGASLTVTRAYAGTQASHADNAVVVGIGTALPEGSDPDAARATDRSNRHNFTQIFGPHKVETSATERVIRKYGLRGTNEFDYQVAQRTKEAAVSIEQALLYGTRNEDTTNKWRTMGGLAYYITTNVDSSTTTLTEAKLLDQLQNIYDAGGSADRAVVGSKQKRVISAFNTNITINVERSERTRGQTVEFFDSDFGRVSILLNRWARVSDLFLFSRDQATVETLRPLSFEMLSKTGDAVKGQIVCEKTLRFRREAHAAEFNALT